MDQSSLCSTKHIFVGIWKLQSDGSCNGDGSSHASSFLKWGAACFICLSVFATEIFVTLENRTLSPGHLSILVNRIYVFVLKNHDCFLHA